MRRLSPKKKITRIQYTRYLFKVKSRREYLERAAKMHIANCVVPAHRVQMPATVDRAFESLMTRRAREDL